MVSALGRVIEGAADNSFIGEPIQTDAAINPGNSSGPLLDLQGRVIAVNSQIISPSGVSSGISFAVSANTSRRVVPDLIERGCYAHRWLGADMMTLSSSVTCVLRDPGVDVSAQSKRRFIEALEVPRLAGEVKLHGSALGVMLLHAQVASDPSSEVSLTLVSASILA